jgi:hypothetical protein
MNLQTFLEELGDEQAALLFGEKIRTVASWRRGERCPARKKIPGLVQKSRGRLTYDDLFDGASYAVRTTSSIEKQQDEHCNRLLT